MPDYDSANVFAKILRGELPAERIYEDDGSFAFMDIMPRSDGHCLVIPKVAARTLFDLPTEALGPFFGVVQKVGRAALAGMGADGLTLQQFNEPAGGQVVFHLHVHILPRWTGIALRPHTGQMADGALLKGHAAKIRAALGPA